MKRALAIAVALCTLGIVGFGQLSGSWETNLTLLPDFGLTDTTLTLNYVTGGFEITSKTVFDDTGFSTQQFDLSGTFGPFETIGSLGFDPVLVQYIGGYGAAKFAFAGITLGVGAIQVNAQTPYATGYSVTMPAGWLTPKSLKVTNLTADPIIQAGMMLQLGDFTLTSFVVDPCTGFEFLDLKITYTGAPFLCCGLTYDFEFYMTKQGFQYVRFSMPGFVELCCGISLDLEVEFGVNSKSISFEPNIATPEGCVKLGLDVGWSDYTLTGIGIDWFEIKCSFAECNKVLFGTAMIHSGTYKYNNVDYTVIAVTAPSAWGLKSGLYEVINEAQVTTAIFWQEYELFQVGLCGSGCCGNQWGVDISVYWAQFYDLLASPVVEVHPTLFGLSRILGEFDIPLFDAFALNFSMGHNLLTGLSDMTVGWTFTF